MFFIDFAFEMMAIYWINNKQKCIINSRPSLTSGILQTLIMLLPSQVGGNDHFRVKTLKMFDNFQWLF